MDTRTLSSLKRFCIALTLALMCAAGAGLARAQSTPARLMSALPFGADSAQATAPSDTPSPAYVLRKGAVSLDVAELKRRPARNASTDGAAGIAAAGATDTIALEVFERHEYAVHITDESRPTSEVLNILGRLDNENIATVSMTLTADSYLITIQDLSASKVYRIVGNAETGLGTVTELDPHLMPPILYTPPLLTP